MMTYGYDPALSEGAVKCPIFQTSTFVFKNAEDGKSFFEVAYGLREKRPTEEPGLIYSRINNPDLEILEDRLTLWDGAEAGLVFCSGMAAISTTLLSFLLPGNVLVHSEPLYGGTEFLIHNVLPRFGIERAGFVAGVRDRGLDDAIQEAAKKGNVGAIYIETPANPTNDLVDIRHCAEMARVLGGKNGHRPLVIVDNTFLGPLWQQPLAEGADLVIYSLTKYVGGHSDVIAGACLGSEAQIATVAGMRTILGTISDPHAGWLLMRSLETLKLRMTSSMKNARYVAEFLADHPKVQKVHYLGLLIHGGEKDAFRLLNSLEIIKLAVSLGGTETLIEHPATMTHSDIPPDYQERLGITPAMLRISIGIEHPEDLIADLSRALTAV
jgi:methionine-gamma-lyase